MNILLVHNQYIHPGGEDTVLANERALLESKGHRVNVATVSNSSITGAVARLKTALYTAASPWGAEWMRQQLAATKPDVVHVHNFFPLLSPSIYRVCNEAAVPVVQTLHNYRTICANAMLTDRKSVV